MNNKIKILKLLQSVSTRKPFGIVLRGQFFRKPFFLVHSLTAVLCIVEIGSYIKKWNKATTEIDVNLKSLPFQSKMCWPSCFIF